MAFSGQHVWVCGASSGIGEALSYEFAKEGAVVSISARNQTRLQQLSTQLNQQSKGHGFCVCDVRDQKAIEDCHAKITKTRGPVDVLVVVSGVNQNNLPTQSLQAEDVEAVISTNLTGAINVILSVLPSMIERRTGRICGVSSLAGYRGLPGASVYGASKAGVSNFLEALRIEMRQHNVLVTDVCPGFVETDALDIDGLGLPRALVLTCADSARMIVNAISTGTSHYGFPWYMEHIVMRLAKMLPNFLYDFLMSFSAADVKEFPDRSEILLERAVLDERFVGMQISEY